MTETMGMILKALIVASILPVLLASAYFYIPEFSTFVRSVLDFDWSENTPPKPLIRYKDGAGRQYYVSSIESVPIEFREHAEVNPDLPRLNRGEFQPIATPTPTPVVKKRGGDGIIRERNRGRPSRAREASFDDDRGREDLPELSDSLPYKAVFDAINQKLGEPGQ